MTCAGPGLAAPDRAVPARLKKRRDFVAVSKGRRIHTPAFTLQAGARTAEAEPGARFGFTVTRRTGSATERNRIRRRFREALRVGHAAAHARPDHDYVIVARREALGLRFPAMVDEVTRAIARIHQDKHRARR